MSPEYINESLVHWTGRSKTENDALDILKTICEEQILRLTYCPNYSDKSYKPLSAMACFTEIPLNFSGQHCNQFGRFGIAFRKETMIEYGANPVLYTTNTHFERIKHIGTLLERMKDLEKDREWKEDPDIEPYQFTEDETIALMEIMELLQEYSHRKEDGIDYITYYQREWRLTFKVLPFAGSDSEFLAGMSCFYIRNGKSYHIFKFKREDVTYLIVPEAFASKAEPLAALLGCELKLYEREVNA